MVRVDNIAAFKDDATDGGTWDVEQTRAHDKANELVSTAGAGVSKWCDPNYDAAGNMTSGPDPRSSALAADPNFRQFYFYDAWNRQAKVSRDTNANGVYDAGADATIALYYYDGENRRVAKAVASGANWDRTDFYYNDSWQVLEERKATGQADANTVATTAAYRYVWDMRYIDSPVCRIGSQGTLYYLNDFNFNVTSLVLGGVVVERYVYDPYGKVTVCDASWNPRTSNQSAYDNDILYCGYRYDAETGLYHVNNRYLHPGIGRWTQWDRIPYPDGMNQWQYVASNPANRIDPTGLALCINDKATPAQRKHIMALVLELAPNAKLKGNTISVDTAANDAQELVKALADWQKGNILLTPSDTNSYTRQGNDIDIHIHPTPDGIPGWYVNVKDPTREAQFVAPRTSVKEYSVTLAHEMIHAYYNTVDIRYKVGVRPTTSG